VLYKFGFRTLAFRTADLRMYCVGGSPGPVAQEDRRRHREGHRRLEGAQGHSPAQDSEPSGGGEQNALNDSFIWDSALLFCSCTLSNIQVTWVEPVFLIRKHMVRVQEIKVVRKSIKNLPLIFLAPGSGS
jgi:hypothetical protein